MFRTVATVIGKIMLRQPMQAHLQPGFDVRRLSALVLSQASVFLRFEVDLGSTIAEEKGHCHSIPAAITPTSCLNNSFTA
jgi:hypothetical protein